MPPLREKDPALSDLVGTASEQEVLTPLTITNLSVWLLLSFSSHVGGLKRKGAPNKKEPRKRRKGNESEVPSEDLLVAMALSRSEMEQKAVPVMLRLGTALSEKTRLGTGMCHHEGWPQGGPYCIATG